MSNQQAQAAIPREAARQPVQRLDPQVAVDQHQPIGVADHHHRHLLPDLGDRADQPPALLAVVDPQIAVPEVRLREALPVLGDRSAETNDAESGSTTNSA
jgi:hypothetical protein